MSKHVVCIDDKWHDLNNGFPVIIPCPLKEGTVYTVFRQDSLPNVHYRGKPTKLSYFLVEVPNPVNPNVGWAADRFIDLDPKRLDIFREIDIDLEEELERELEDA